MAAQRAIAAVASGDRISDKLAIAVLLGRRGLFPLAYLRHVGIEFPDPGYLIKAYTCKSNGLVVRCPGGGGPYFLFCDFRHDSGVRGAIDALESGTFIDVGAHVGFFALPAARHLGRRGNVVAVEPHPVRFQFLEENVARNRLNNVACLPYALGDRNGDVTLYDLDRRLGRHARDVSLNPSGGPGLKVHMRTLDSLCEELSLESISLIKIDVEGFEPQVIAGMTGVLERWSPAVVFEALTLQSLHASSSLLSRHGYGVRQVDSTNYLAERRDG